MPVLLIVLLKLRLVLDSAREGFELTVDVWRLP